MTLEELKTVELVLKNPDHYRGLPTYYLALEAINKEIVLKETDYIRNESPNKPQNVKCPDCGGDMIPRHSMHGNFWGCKKYPQCKGTRDSMGRSKADREADRARANIDKSDDHEDVGPDNSQYRWRR